MQNAQNCDDATRYCHGYHFIVRGIIMAAGGLFSSCMLDQVWCDLDVRLGGRVHKGGLGVAELAEGEEIRADVFLGTLQAFL